MAAESADVKTVRAAIALGANLGEPAKALEDAAARLAKIEQTRLVACSGVYYSHPLGPPGQPDYLNRVALIETSLPPYQLLDKLQSIEALHGRARHEHWGARTLDLDIIVYGDMVLNDERLTLPHPHAHRRSFVLEPLAELAPEMVIPGHGAAAELAAAADDGLIYRRPDDASRAPDFRYIAIEGPVGVGKSSLAQRLAQDYDARLILEQVDDNPFLEHFYAGAEGVALPTQLYFLMSRVRQLKELHQEDLFSSISISDFVIEKDRLFASLVLEHAHFQLYQMIYDSLVGEHVKPDLVVYLQAPVEVLIRRILKRGRSFERTIEESYLHRLSEKYSDFFYHYDDSALLIINTGDIDFVENETQYRSLKQAILSAGGGKQYYNPLGGALSG